MLIPQYGTTCLTSVSAERGLTSHSLKVPEEDSGRKEEFYFIFILFNFILMKETKKKDKTNLDTFETKG